VNGASRAGEREHEARTVHFYFYFYFFLDASWGSRPRPRRIIPDKTYTSHKFLVNALGK